MIKKTKVKINQIKSYQERKRNSWTNKEKASKLKISKRVKRIKTKIIRINRTNRRRKKLRLNLTMMNVIFPYLILIKNWLKDGMTLMIQLWLLFYQENYNRNLVVKAKMAIYWSTDKRSYVMMLKTKKDQIYPSTGHNMLKILTKLTVHKKKTMLTLKIN